jgi:hypothetical protein
VQDADADEDDNEEEEQMQAAAPAKTSRKKQRKEDANVVMLNMGRLGEEPVLITGDPVTCRQCQAVLSSTSVLSPQQAKGGDAGKKMWKW